MEFPYSVLITQTGSVYQPRDKEERDALVQHIEGMGFKYKEYTP